MDKVDLKNLILTEINSSKQVQISDLISKTGFTRAYLNRFLQELRQDHSSWENESFGLCSGRQRGG
jgi:hypothetical protein